MVRNTSGGSKTKSQGRKFSSNYASRSATRMSENSLEQYAIVIKNFGQGRCLVHTTNDVELQCVIRNKFRGRSKRNNIVAVGSVLLIGLREWEGADNYKTCDVLEVYDAEDVNQLRSIPSTNIKRLDRFVNTHFQSTTTNDELQFSEDADGDLCFVKAQKLPAGGGDLGAINEHSDDDIDIDDI
jgi:hypothetical protein